jgi:sugar phosphate isomerase/epimerase
MKRRDFLNASAGVAAASALGVVPLSGTAFGQECSSKRLPGAMLYSVRELLSEDVRSVLDSMRAFGIVDIEFFELDGPLGENERFFGLSAQDFRDAVEASELDMTVAHIEYDWQNAADVSDLAIDLGIDTVVLANADEFFELRGGKYYTVPAKSLAQLDSIANRMNVAGQQYRELGLTFAYHNHHIEFVPVEGVIPFDYLMERTDSNFVKLELDVGWIAIAGVDPAAYMRRYGDRVISCHLKDFNSHAELSESPEFSEYQQKALVEPGAGTTDFGPVLSAIEDIGVKHAFIEIDISADPLHAIERGHQYLNNLQGC